MAASEQSCTFLQLGWVVWQGPLTSGTVQDGVFTAATRLQLDKLGNYRIDVDVVDRALGASSSWATVAEVQAGGWDTSGHTLTATADQPAAGQWRAYYAGIPHEVQTAVSTKGRVTATT